VQVRRLTRRSEAHFASPMISVRVVS
jgi:hypothetical protein